MKICIPHYTKLVERRRSLESELRRMGLSATWITEFDQEDITDEMTERFVDQSTLRERAAVTEKASGGKPFPQKPLKLSEVSIALKHMEIFRKHSETPDGFIVVIEDDVQFQAKNFPRAFERDLANTPSDWDMIFFGDSGIFFEKRLAHRLLNRLLGKTVFRKLHPATRCLDSYAIKSEAASRLVQAIDKVALPFDWELNYWIAKLDLKVFWWEPGLTVQGSQSGTYRSSIRE